MEIKEAVSRYKEVPDFFARGCNYLELFFLVNLQFLWKEELTPVSSVRRSTYLIGTEICY